VLYIYNLNLYVDKSTLIALLQRFCDPLQVSIYIGPYIYLYMCRERVEVLSLSISKYIILNICIGKSTLIALLQRFYDPLQVTVYDLI